MKSDTKISWGYKDLIKTFFEANDIKATLYMREEGFRNHITIIIDDEESASAATFLSYKHLGIENMLCDYLVRCGISKYDIGFGAIHKKRNMAELDKQWEEHKKKLGI